MNAAATVAPIVRHGLVMLFLPFSALDTLLGFGRAVDRAGQVSQPRPAAIVVLSMGLAIERLCSRGVVAGDGSRPKPFLSAPFASSHHYRSHR